MKNVPSSDPSDVVSALLETFFPPCCPETEEEKRPLIAQLLRTPGNEDPDTAAEVRAPRMTVDS